MKRENLDKQRRWCLFVLVFICFTAVSIIVADESPAAKTNGIPEFSKLLLENKLPTNPVLRGADPHAAIFGDKIYVYPTAGGSLFFYAFSSKDLQRWERHGPVLNLQEIKWVWEDGQTTHYAWAPCIVEHEGKFYFYYSVGPQNPTPSRIGVAVGDSPEGPFTDSGKPLLTGDSKFEAIDPMVFKDPVSKKYYLYAGGSAGAKLRIFELTAKMTEIAREIPCETPRFFTEGVFMHYYNGKYYLSYSHGSWRHSSYSVHYSISDKPFGPWEYKGCILQSDERFKGPGHHSFLFDENSGKWLIFYHRWENVTGDGPYRGFRQTCIEFVEYDSSGMIKPIKMTGAERTIR
jgi:beta-xylosidase